ncbi:MAG: DUF4279 domain-containing protein [Verrucomicrobia subdivision 3 bacterium]|nr:DUF4279 domain-containing protein [Limisphaerales bacterium]
MTMEHIARSFKVSLSVTHPDIDPTQISTALALAADRATRAGSSRTTPKGEPLAGAYEFSSWTHQFDAEGASELGVVLEGLVERLQRHQQFFHRLVREGGSVELFCGVFAAGNWDEILSHSLMAKLAALRVDLRLDVYPKNDDTAP